MSGRDILDALLRAAMRPPPPPPSLGRLFRPPPERFEELRRDSVPLLLDGLVEPGPGGARWSLAGLRERFADRVLPAIPTTNGRIRSDVRTGVPFGKVRLGDYLDRLERGDWPEAYLAAAGDAWLPELVDELRPPEYWRKASWRNSRFWLSPPQTSVPLHRDVAENFFFQLCGRKRFYLYPPAATPWLYSNPLSSALPNYSRFDPEEPDYRCFPLSREVRPVEVVLGPGDALYLPTRWWHQVRSLEVSASFGFWWANGALALVVRAAELTKRLRGLEIYGLRAKGRGVV